MKNPKVVIVMPAYNAANTLKDTFQEIPKRFRKNIIVVDDNSSDNTVTLASVLGLTVIKHTKNLGYGANQKTCYKEAFKLKPDIIVMLHPDYQYDASFLPHLIDPIAEGKYDFMFGSRISDRAGALNGGMPKLKYFINRIVCLIENIVLGVNFSEHFSGFRAYSKNFIRKVPYKKFSNDFVFDQQMTMSALKLGYKIGETPIPTRYHSKASSIKFLKGAKFLLETFWNLVLFKLDQLKLVRPDVFN